MPEKYLELSFVDVIGLVKRRFRIFIILPALTLFVGVMINSARDVTYSVDIPYRLNAIPPSENSKTYMARFEDMFFDSEKFEAFDNSFKQSGIEYSDIIDFEYIENFRFQKLNNKVVFGKDSVTIYISKPDIVAGMVNYLNFIASKLDDDVKNEVRKWTIELEKMGATLIKEEVEFLYNVILRNERFLHLHENDASGLAFLTPIQPKRVGISDAALLLISLVLGTIFSFIWSLITTDFNE